MNGMVKAWAALAVGFVTATGAAECGVQVEWVRTICKEPGRYIGWPSVARLKDGALMAVFSGDRERHVCPYGKVQMVRSDDGGETWSAPVTIGDTPIDDRDASIHQLPDGEILVSWFTSVAYLHNKKYKAEEKRSMAELERHFGRWCVRSKDGGRTWTKPAPMAIVGSTPHGPIVLKDGALLNVGRWTPGAQSEATATRESRTDICCERSEDGGRTWKMLCARFPDTDGESAVPHAFHEPHVAELSDGRLVALIRYHGKDECLRGSSSSDGGKTWSPMKKTSLKAGYSAMHLLGLPDGRVLATYSIRNQKTRLGVGEFVALSSDAGETWSRCDAMPLRISPPGVTTGDIGYPATIALQDGSFLTVFYEPERAKEPPCLMAAKWRLGESACKPAAVKRGALCITVDDRNFDNWEASLPLFAKYGSHATFFAYGPIDARAESCLRHLSEAGHSIGLHGLKHLKSPESVAKLGEEGYIAAEILPQLSACREKGLPVKSFAYPMSAHTPETDALLLKHFSRLRGGGGEFKAPFPFAEAGKRRFVAGLGSVGVNHTGEKVAGMLREVAERNLVLVVYTHGILNKPTTHCTSRADLELILSTAKGLGVAALGFDELPVD